MEKYETRKLYIVRPSIVISDDTRRIEYNKIKNTKKFKHVVVFENNSNDIDIVTTAKCNILYNSLFNSRRYFEGIGHHCCEGDYHVGVNKDDIMLLAKYLYINSVSNPEWNMELQKYIISLKPYYDYDELKDIFEQSKPKKEESITTKTLKNTYTI